MIRTYDTQIKLPNEEVVEKAAELLKKGELVAIPTETVYGLAASALDNNAVEKIFTAKNRPQDNPLISHISDINMMSFLCDEIPETAQKLAKAFWPGPLTMIVKRAGKVCDRVCAGLDTVAVRMPSHEVALRIIKAAGIPLAAPSANISGAPSPTKASDVYADMCGKIELIVDGGECEVGVESTVISIVGDIPTILRPGTVTKEQIEQVLNQKVENYEKAQSAPSEGDKILSPGLKYRHYAPKTNVILVKGNMEKYCTYVNNKAKGKSGVFALCFAQDEKHLNCPVVVYGEKNDSKQLAKNLFSSLRKLDDENASIAYAHCPDENGVGFAVYNRMLRAAAFKVVNLDD